MKEKGISNALLLFSYPRICYLKALVPFSILVN